jgi:very-short-patch-repair endonuclease
MVHSDKKPNGQVTGAQRANAKALRREMTDAERVIWYALRAHRLLGAAFRRQAPVGPYIVDFVCHAAGLIIEIDGGQHFEPEGAARDARRTAFLNVKGFSVLRFSNHDVMTNKSGVIEAIAATLERLLPPP